MVFFTRSGKPVSSVGKTVIYEESVNRNEGGKSHHDFDKLDKDVQKRDESKVRSYFLGE